MSGIETASSQSRAQPAESRGDQVLLGERHAKVVLGRADRIALRRFQT